MTPVRSTEMRRLSTVPGVVLVSIAAAMWGLDGLIRKPLSNSTSPTTIVFGEHVVLVALTLPLLVQVESAHQRLAKAADRISLDELVAIGVHPAFVVRGLD